MISRRSAAALVVALAALMSARGADAQSLPPVTKAKAAATGAAAATDAHTRTMTTPPAEPAPRPAAQQPATRSPTKAPAAGAQSRDTSRAGGAGQGGAEAREGEEQTTLRREVFNYEGTSRRDPFKSLLNTSELRPMIGDLRLVAIVYDPAGRSVAVLRDLQTKDQYRVRVGQAIGRMRVAAIGPKSVMFTILEFGESRQETLQLNDSTRVRKP